MSDAVMSEGRNQTSPDTRSTLKRPNFGLVRAFGFSRDGYTHALRSERAVRQEVFVLAVAIPLAAAFAGDVFRFALLVASVLAVLAVELLNTAIEKVCDHVSPSVSPAVKAIKDMGSAAVLTTIAAGALLWGAALWQRLS